MNKGVFLFLIYSLNGGGAERVMSVLCNNLVKHGYEVHLGIYNRSDDDYPLRDEVKIHMLSEKKYNSKIKNIFYRIKQISNLIKEVKPNFVVPFLGTVVIESFVASRFKKTTFISAVRNDPAQAHPKKLEKYLFLLVNCLSTAIFVQNNMQKEYYPRIVQKKVFAVFNPVSEHFVENSHSDIEKIVNIATSGRLDGQKNHKMLIDAMEIVAERHSEVKLTIYGAGKLREELDGYIIEKKLEDNVKMFGRTNDMMGELQKKDLFVMSSDYEGMPNALLEAMALGMPCISTDCRTGPSEMIENYKSGILVPIKDAEKMAEAICYMVEHPNEANEMGKNARKFALENCTVDVITEKFVCECEKFRKNI